MFETSTSSRIDEVPNYLDCRYLSTYKSCLRLFECPIYHKELVTQWLFIHLLVENNIYFNDRKSIHGIIAIPDIE